MFEVRHGQQMGAHMRHKKLPKGTPQTYILKRCLDQILYLLQQ